MKYAVLPITSNLLLRSLDPSALSALDCHLETLEFEAGARLCDQDTRIEWAYFPLSGLTSLVQVLSDGNTIELANIGSRGAIGIMAGFGIEECTYDAVIQTRSVVARIAASRLQALYDEYPSFARVVITVNEAFVVEVEMSLTCNVLHEVRRRFCGWLLHAGDTLQSDAIPVTQETIAGLLGVRRTSISPVASDLQAKEIIRYSRGKIEILNRKELEDVSCECYRASIDRRAKILKRY